ncbi:MAG: diadenylate cyclase CdaA [Eubacteriales bacterium]
METIASYLSKNTDILHIPSNIRWEDLAEIVILSFLVYHIMLWIKKTKAWALLKGVIVIVIFIMIAAIFQMTTILWIVSNVLSTAVIAIVIVMQPELRRALEQLGEKNLISSIIPFESEKRYVELFSDRTLSEIAKACVEMSKVKTGALIVIEKNISLSEYERTGIEVDAIVTSQLLINIFEHNTPLHDGAVIVRGNRATYATCYLPLSDNMELSKDLGTRHRAGIGISEATDSLTVIVSEETGAISVAYAGTVKRNLTVDELREQLLFLQNKTRDDKKIKLWKGRTKHEEANNE